MDKQSLFLIRDIPGFTPQIARLVSMMNYVRYTTVSAVEGLGINELDYLHDSYSNSIGSLLLHIAATEVGYRAATFYKRDLNSDEKSEWEAAYTLGDKARHEIKGQEIDYYLNKLKQVRAKTLAEFACRDDKWLEEQTTFPSLQCLLKKALRVGKRHCSIRGTKVYLFSLVTMFSFGSGLNKQ